MLTAKGADFLEKRIITGYCLILAGLGALLLALYGIAAGKSGNFAAAAAQQSSYLLEVGETRGLIYDRNLSPLVGTSSHTVLAVSPSAGAAAQLHDLLLPEFLQEEGALLREGRPFLVDGQALTPETRATPVQALSSPDGSVLAFSLPERWAPDQTALHLIGYTDAAGKGVCGIEKGYDDFLREQGGVVRVRYTVNALGSALPESAPTVEDTRGSARGGVVLTLDKELQKTAEEALEPIERGAAVVMDVATGEILAMASVPCYDLADLSAALESTDSPFLNRALCAYNLGSAFKIVTAAAALEAGFSTAYTFNCPGWYELDGQIYRCHRLVGHGAVDMKKALEQSCNPYFINLGLQAGAQRLCGMAEAFGFGTAVRLAPGVLSASGSMPAAAEIGEGELANLSFGQGRLTATPVQAAQMIAIVAGGGKWVSPTLVRGVTYDGVTVSEQTVQTPEKRVISEQTARTLREMLINAVEEGSGMAAKPAVGGAGGKTASAQTGSFDQNGEEIVHAWFAGFYPAEDPRWAIVFFGEGSGSGGGAPARAFKAFCDAAARIGEDTASAPRISGPQ